ANLRPRKAWRLYCYAWRKANGWMEDHGRLLAEPVANFSLESRVCPMDGGDHDLRIPPLGRHPSDRPADRDVWWSEHTFPSRRRPDLHAEPVAPGPVARRACARRCLAHPGARRAPLCG